MTTLSRIWNAVRQVSPSAIALIIVAPLTVGLVTVTLLHTPLRPESVNGVLESGPTPVPTVSRSPSQNSAAPSPSATSRPHLVAFLGDSYALGTGATKRSKRWATLVSIDQGWVEKNLSQGGTSYSSAGDLGGRPYTERIDGVVASGAQIVVVSGGRRDLDVAAKQFRADVRATFKGIRAGLPTAEIIVVSPIWDNGRAPVRMSNLTSIVKAEADRVQATYLDIGDPMLGHSEMVLPNSPYPNNAGHAAIAAAVEKALAP